jgi:hypothetical protein
MMKAFSTAQPDGHTVDKIDPVNPNIPMMEVIDWLRIGQLLREELGWQNTYPAQP